MIKLKYKRQFILFVIAILCMHSLSFTAYADSSSQKQALTTYSVTTTISGKGSLYWDYGKNMSFFLENGYKTYNADCKIKNKSTYKFSKVFNRGIIAKPNSG